MTSASLRIQVATALAISIASPMTWACQKGEPKQTDNGYYTPMRPPEKHDDRIIGTTDDTLRREDQVGRRPDIAPATLDSTAKEVRKLRRLARRYKGTTCSGTASEASGSMSCMTPQGKTVTFKVLTTEIAAKLTKGVTFIENTIADTYAQYVAGNSGTIATPGGDQSAFTEPVPILPAALDTRAPANAAR